MKKKKKKLRKKKVSSFCKRGIILRSVFGGSSEGDYCPKYCCMRICAVYAVLWKTQINVERKSVFVCCLFVCCSLHILPFFFFLSLSPSPSLSSLSLSLSLSRTSFCHVSEPKDFTKISQLSGQRNGQPGQNLRNQPNFQKQKICNLYISLCLF